MLFKTWNLQPDLSGAHFLRMDQLDSKTERSGKK